MAQSLPSQSEREAIIEIIRVERLVLDLKAKFIAARATDGGGGGGGVDVHSRWQPQQSIVSSCCIKFYPAALAA